MWPLHFKHSHWWKRWSRSKFASHYAWGTTGVCECKMDVESTWISYLASEWTMFHGHLDCIQNPPLGGRPNTKPGDHGTPNVHNRRFILFYHVWGSTWIEIHWNSIWLRAGHIWLHTTLEDPWPLYMILKVCWDGLWTLFLGALTISWSWLLDHVWSGLEGGFTRALVQENSESETPLHL